MNKFLISMLFSLFSSSLAYSWEPSYAEHFFYDQAHQEHVLQAVAARIPSLVNYPAYRYPNEKHEHVMNAYPHGKILIFGYGSLMNKDSAARSIKAESIETMETAVAFGVKRIFNYKASKTRHWQENIDVKERAMLNLTQTFNLTSLVNGVTIEVDLADFSRLVAREVGYDLVPILVVSEKDILEENPNPEVRVAYTFMAMNELRHNVNYTSTKYYPVRGYLHAIQETSEMYGERFAWLWNQTTFLADGITRIEEWDQKTFKGILCTFEPMSD